MTLGVAWASGIRLYAVVLMLGLLGKYGYFELPYNLGILMDPLVLAAAGLMFCIEFFVDKIPGADSGWDVVHSFIRIPAGALLAMAAVGETTPAIELTALLLGGTLATATHATKASTRLMLQSSPEPVSNWLASVSEDGIVVAGLWAALYHPWLFLTGLLLFIGFMAWLLPITFRAIIYITTRIKRLYIDAHSKISSNLKQDREVKTK